jgi:PPM family protein phosphatase
MAEDIPTVEQAVPTAESTGSTEAPSARSDALEELTLPPTVQAPEPLPPDTVLGPGGRLRIADHLGARGYLNYYTADWTADEAGETVPVEVREAADQHAGLSREAEILTTVRYAMLPELVATFEHEDRQYLAVERLDGPTLEQALARGLDPEQAVSIMLQLTQVLRRLHQSGWGLPGLAPADVLVGQPIRLTQLGGAVRIGEVLPLPLHVPGYSAPELTLSRATTGKEDAYALGAILFRALAGHALAESGPELAALPSQVRLPGGPQILVTALAPTAERVDLETLYQQLLALKQRLGHVALALEVASATTVGLNPTRTVNEDSCGYLTWSSADADGASFQALLCVADGMGGMDAGELASGTALRAILAGAQERELDNPGERAGEDTPDSAGDFSPARSHPLALPLDPVALIRRAAPAVHAAGAGRAMGTTVTCVVVRDGLLTLGHIGDTRAYLFHSRQLTQLTADHSLVAAMVASGMLTNEEARGHPDSNKVLRSLGGQRELPEGFVDGLATTYGQPSLRLQAGDWLMLCTDGVWGAVDDTSLSTILSEALDPPNAARAAIERALDAGAPDNATVLVARCVEVPAR